MWDSGARESVKELVSLRLLFPFFLKQENELRKAFVVLIQDCIGCVVAKRWGTRTDKRTKCVCPWFIFRRVKWGTELATGSNPFGTNMVLYSTKGGSMIRKLYSLLVQEPGCSIWRITNYSYWGQWERIHDLCGSG